MQKLLTLLAFVLLTVGVVAAEADKASASRYDSKTARKLTPGEIKGFGPGATKYRYDARMIRAAELAAQRARARSSSRCWRYVKYALLEAKAIDTYPETVYAKQAAGELSKEYGFRKLSVRDPYRAPVGAVLVYGGRGAGHVEIRTKTGFVSDFRSLKPSPRPFLGAYVLPRS